MIGRSLNSDYAADIYCGLKIYAAPLQAGQNRSDRLFRNGFLRLATIPTA